MSISLQSLSLKLLQLVEDQLSNDESSSNEELQEHFIQSGLAKDQAQEAIELRSRYLMHVYHEDFTPIRTPGRALRFNPHIRDFEPE